MLHLYHDSSISALYTPALLKSGLQSSIMDLLFDIEFNTGKSFTFSLFFQHWKSLFFLWNDPSPSRMLEDCMEWAGCVYTVNDKKRFLQEWLNNW